MQVERKTYERNGKHVHQNAYLMSEREFAALSLLYENPLAVEDESAAEHRCLAEAGFRIGGDDGGLAKWHVTDLKLEGAFDNGLEFSCWIEFATAGQAWVHRGCPSIAFSSESGETLYDTGRLDACMGSPSKAIAYDFDSEQAAENPYSDAENLEWIKAESPTAYEHITRGDVFEIAFVCAG